MSYQIKNGEIVAKDTEGHTRKFPKANVDVVISECRRLGISNKYLIAGILAVISKESGFVPKNENLNYSEKGLKGTFGSYFNPSRANAAEYAKKPEKIANYVYGGTWNGNKYSLGRYGNTVQGDGFKYRGRGFNQITFKSGYEKYQKLIPSVIPNPDLLNNPKEAATANAEFFLNNFKNSAKTIKANYGKSAFDMSSWDEALLLCANANAGLGKGPKNEKVIWAYNNSKKCHKFLIDYLEQNPQGSDFPPDNPSNVDNNAQNAQNNQPVDNTQPTSAEQENAEQGSNSQSNDPNSNNNVNNGQPVTILTQFFKPSVSPTPINFKVDELNKSDKNKVQKQLGYTPFVYYNGVPIGYKDVKNVNLYHRGILPSIEITFVDTWGLFRQDAFPYDDTLITIYLNSRSKNLRSIHMDFKILDFKDNGDNSYTINGICNIPEIFLRKFTSYSKKTSHEALQEVAKQCNLGFCSNIQNSDDKMSWINTGLMVKDFIENVINNSYVSETSFQHVYIDFYYNICYVDIYKEMERDVSDDKMISSFGYKFLTSEEENEEVDEKVVDMVLLNDKSVKDSNAFILEFEIVNKSTKVSLQKSYRTRSKYYDIINKELLIFDVESQTSDGSKSIILKSRPNDDKFFQENTNNVYLGKLDMFNEGEGNMHKNYNYSIPQNRQNLDDITKVSAKLVLPNLNFNLYVYQKIQIFFTPHRQSSTEDPVYKRISGDWLITGIEFNYDNGSQTQVITAIKRELTLLPDEIDNTPRRRRNDSENSNQNSPNELSPNDTPPNDPVPGQQPSNVANTQNPDKPQSQESTDLPGNNLTNPPGTSSKLLYISKDKKYIINPSEGVAGKRLKKVLSDLQAHLRANGYPEAKIGNLGVMRDLYGAAYPSSPARAKGSLHGAGLAIDTTWSIPGKKWDSIGDNGNLASDSKLVKTIWNWVVSQKDLKWGAEFGAKSGSNPSAGVVKGRGITEFHHFELKTEYIKQYWDPWSKHLSDLGFSANNLDSTSKLQKLYEKLLA